jgi:DNA modification methylase
LYLGDCREIAPTLPRESCNLLLADPPYGMGKEKDGVANDNLRSAKLDAFLMECWQACRPAIKSNGSAYIWGEPESLWRLWYRGGLADSERLTFRNEIIWRDPSGVSWGKDGMEGLRQYAPDGERALFFMLGEQGFNNNAENYWEGWDSVVNYLRQEKEKTGWDIATFKRLAGHSEKSGCHWFDRSQWSMPTRAVYDSWRNAAEGVAFKREHDDLKREHDDLKREHDDLKREFYATRAFFDNSHQNMTDVWHFARVNGNERHGHPTPKPVAMMARAVKTSCPPGGTVLDPFAGTCPTAIACIRTGRRFIGIECDPTHYAAAVQRITNELAQGDLFAGHNH